MPIIVTVKTFAVVALHVKVADPDPLMLAGVMEPHVRPAGTESVNETVPANPLVAVTVIVEVRDWPGLPDGEVAVMAKSWTVKLAVAEWDNVPVVPVKVRT